MSRAKGKAVWSNGRMEELKDYIQGMAMENKLVSPLSVSKELNVPMERIKQAITELMIEGRLITKKEFERRINLLHTLPGYAEMEP